MTFYERGLEDKSTESKINEFDYDFAEKLKTEEGYISENVNRNFTKIKTEIKLNYDSKLKLNTKR